MTVGSKAMAFLVAAVTCLAIAVIFLSLTGCNKLNSAKDRAALLACKGHGGYKTYKPKLTHLYVECNDGTAYNVEWY